MSPRASALFAVPTIYQALVRWLATPTGMASAGLGGRRAAGPAPGDMRLGSAEPGPGRQAADRAGAAAGDQVRHDRERVDVSDPVADPRGDTIGVPLPGVLARIRTPDGVADPGADGEIQVRGPQVFTGYWRDPAGTEAAFTPDGWFRTGDIGAVDSATGHLVIRGRTKEMIITGGLNVYPREVEIALESHPLVAEAAVAGVADERWGER